MNNLIGRIAYCKQPVIHACTVLHVHLLVVIDVESVVRGKGEQNNE